MELATLVEMDEAGRLWEDLKSGESLDRLHAVNTEEWIFVVLLFKKTFKSNKVIILKLLFCLCMTQESCHLFKN